MVKLVFDHRSLQKTDSSLEIFAVNVPYCITLHFTQEAFIFTQVLAVHIISECSYIKDQRVGFSPCVSEVADCNRVNTPHPHRHPLEAAKNDKNMKGPLYSRSVSLYILGCCRNMAAPWTRTDTLDLLRSILQETTKLMYSDEVFIVTFILEIQCSDGNNWYL